MNRLTDHRRFATATALTVVVLCGLLSALFVAAGRLEAVPGLCAGSAVALADVWLTVRVLNRLQRRGAATVGARALAVATFSRFLLIALLIGVVLTARGLNPVGVVVGFMLMPLAIILVGVMSLWRESHGGGRRLNGAAG